MELTALALFIVFSCTATVVPGPNALLTVKAALSGGRSASELTILGICFGHLVWGSLAVLGIVALLERMPLLLQSVKLVGAGYIFWMGVTLVFPRRTETHSTKHRAERRAGLPRKAAFPFLEGLLTALLNPNTGLFFLSLFPQFLAARANNVPLGAALVVIHVGIAAGWFSLLGQFASRTGSSKQALDRTVLLKIAGGALMGFGYAFAWSA